MLVCPINWISKRRGVKIMNPFNAKCINNKNYDNQITVGKTYLVLRKFCNLYTLYSDKGEKIQIMSKCFEITDKEALHDMGYVV